jgi:hypothetical protein
MRSWPDAYDPVESYWSDEPRIPGERPAEVVTKRRSVVGCLAGLAALLPATILARRTRREQIGCPSKCTPKCCLRTWEYVGGVCLKNPRDCSASAKEYCHRKGRC